MSNIYAKKIINGLGLDSSECDNIIGGESVDYSNVINDNYQTIMLNYINELNFNDITVGGYSSDSSDSEKSIDITQEQHAEIVGGLDDSDNTIIVNDIEVIVKDSVEEQPTEDCPDNFCDESFVNSDNAENSSSSDSNDSDSENESNFDINNFIKKK